MTLTLSVFLAKQYKKSKKWVVCLLFLCPDFLCVLVESDEEVTLVVFIRILFIFWLLYIKRLREESEP